MGSDLTKENLRQALCNLPGDTTHVEIMTHPGYPSEPNKGGLPLPDEFSISKDRFFELSQLQTFQDDSDFFLK